MRSGRTIGIVMLVALLLATSVLGAQSFTTEIITLQERILPGETALYELAITNNLETPDTYTISSQEFGFILIIDETPGAIGADETGVFTLEVTPRNYVTPGTRRIPLQVRSATTKELETLNPVLVIRDPNRTEGVYTPSIALGVDAPDVVDPREDVLVSVHLRNRNARAYLDDDRLLIRITSDLFNRDYQTSLGPIGLEGEKAQELRFDIDPYQPPGMHDLLVEVLVDGEEVSSERLTYEVVSFSTIEETSFVEKGFFTKTTTYKLRNDGNVAATGTVEYRTNVLQRLFTKTSEEYEIDSTDEYSLVLTNVLDPREERTITVTENYRLLALLIVVLIISIIGYYLLRSPIVLGKEAILTGSPEEGVSQITVRLLVKNRSSKTLRNLRVIDRISGMADILKEESLGTLKPTKVVKKKNQGTLLRWDVDVLEPFEERIISYKATSQLKLVGDVTLPAVKVKFDIPSGRERTAHSNEVSITRNNA